ncbi:MAG: flagellar M-ring protein FliF C-terminal domain-containing protein [Lachnospirales bacterium]
MKERLQKNYVLVKEKWNNLERGQKALITLTTLVLIVTMGIFIYITIKPDRAILISNLTAQQVGEAGDLLTSAGIYNEPTERVDGVIVNREDLQEAEIVIAKSELASTSGFTFADALDASGMGSTSDVKRNAMIRAEETDMANQLKLFEGVKDASVELNIPQTNNFLLKDDKKSSAAVVLVTSSTIGRNEAQGMARLVAAAVDGLSISDVEIMDQNREIIYSGADMSDTNLFLYEQEQQKKAEIEKNIRTQLLPLYNDVRVSTNLVLDNTKSSVYNEEYENPFDAESSTGFVKKEDTEEQSAKGGTISGEPGVSSNDGGLNTYETGDGTESSADLNRENRDYQYNVTKTQSEKPGGNIVQGESSISLTVYNYRVYDEAVIRESGELEEKGITWDEYKNSIENIRLEIDNDIITNIQAGTGIQNVSIIGYEVPEFKDIVVEEVNVQQIVMYVVLALLILLLAIGLIRNTQEEEIEDVEPELVVEDLLVSTQIEEEEELQRLKQIEYNAELETKKQIDDFIKEKPDAVAQLLRNWLSDDWE